MRALKSVTIFQGIFPEKNFQESKLQSYYFQHYYIKNDSKWKFSFYCEPRSYLPNPSPSPHSNPFLPLPLWSTLQSQSIACTIHVRRQYRNWQVSDSDTSAEDQASCPQTVNTWMIKQISYRTKLETQTLQRRILINQCLKPTYTIPFDSEFAIIYRKLQDLTANNSCISERE